MSRELDTLSAEVSSDPDAAPTARLEYSIEASAGSGPVQQFRCDDCDEVIGVYEPLVMLEGEHVRSTSRAAEPTLEATLGGYYHRDCYVARHACERVP